MDPAHGPARHPRGVPDRPPYQAGRDLWAWSYEHRGYLAGRVALAGGDIETYTLREFLNVGYTVVVEAWAGAKGTLIGGLEAASEWREGGPPKPAETGDVPAVSEDALAAQNVDALAELEGMLMGLKRTR